MKYDHLKLCHFFLSFNLILYFMTNNWTFLDMDYEESDYCCEG